MKKSILLLLALSLSVPTYAQSPNKMSYQTNIRNGSALVVDATVGIRVSIHQGSSTGTLVYQETQTPQANANGLVSMVIGEGTMTSGSLASMDWSDGPYFVTSETDPS